MNIGSWCDRIIKIGFYLLFLFVPVILTPFNYELFEYNKMMTVYGLTVIIVGAWVIKMVHKKEIRLGRTPFDIPLLLFLASQLVSALFSMDPHVSWFGYYSRFNGGMWSVICYVLLYYAFVSNKEQNTPKSIGTLLKIALSTATIVATYAILERLGIDKHLWVQDVQNRVFSTLGQPNWLAAYLVSLIPIAIAFGRGRYIWHIVAMLFFLVLLFTKSRSGLLGFAVADCVFWGLLYIRTQKRRLLLPSFGILHLAFGIIVLINGTSIESINKFISVKSLQNQPTTLVATPSGTLLETGGTESGTIRKYVWQGAINAWRSSTKTLLIGTGTETFAFAFYQHRPVEHNLTSEWDFLYNKAHNEYLNYLATTGLFGLGSYLLFIGAVIYWFVKFSIFNFQFSMKNSNFKFQIEDKQYQQLIIYALFSGWISILITNFFGFSVVVVQLFFFLFPALLVSSVDERLTYTFIVRLRDSIRNFLSLAVLLAILALLVLLSRTWYADRLFASGYRASRAGILESAGPYLTQAIALNPNEPLYHDEAATVFSGLAVSAVENKEATLAAELAKKSLQESDTAIAISPNNVNFWKTRTKVFYTFSSFDPVFNKAAIEALGKALSLSPNDPKIAYNLAILYGREADNTKAIDLLKNAIIAKPNYRDAYWALAIFYDEVHQPNLAKSILTQYLNLVDPNDTEFHEKLNE